MRSRSSRFSFSRQCVNGRHSLRPHTHQLERLNPLSPVSLHMESNVKVYNTLLPRDITMTSDIDLMPVTSPRNEQAGFGKMIVQEIWGDTDGQQGCESLLQLLEGYLNHCDQEQRFASRHRTILGETFDLDLIRTIRVVKARPEVLKSALSEDLGQDAHAVSLDIAIRLMFSTFVRLADTRIISGTIFQPRWRDSESLVSFLTRVYPQTQSLAALAQDNGRVQIAKFSTVSHCAPLPIFVKKKTPPYLPSPESCSVLLPG